jgi:hypothetical protein
MGYWKDIQIRLGGGNAPAHEDEYVCAACITDPGLQGCIETEADATTCSFCSAKSDEPVAAPLLAILFHIKESLEREYDDAENKLSYDGREGGYFGEIWTTEELLWEYLADDLPNDDDGSLMTALCDGLGDRTWCRKQPYSLTADEKLNYSWEHFCDVIKHQQRFFFLRRKDPNTDILNPLALLRELEKWCRQHDIITTLSADAVVYRARFQKPDERLSTPADLGPPPQDKATMTNRMSPPGIVMFYGSDETETTVREVAKDLEKDAGTYVIGKFRVLRGVRILDLSDIPPVPSIFEPIPDTLEYDPRPPLKFLNYFADDLSKPIARDQSVHVEYIPTQVVTEYFRTEFLDDGMHIAGIKYCSARHPGHCSLVLFAGQEDLVGGNKEASSRPFDDVEPWIELIDVQTQEVTAGDLQRWDDEVGGNEISPMSLAGLASRERPS